MRGLQIKALFFYFILVQCFLSLGQNQIMKTIVRPLNNLGERRCLGYTCEIIEETKFKQGYIDAYLPYVSPETNEANIYCCVVVTEGELKGRILILEHASLEVVLDS